MFVDLLWGEKVGGYQGVLVEETRVDNVSISVSCIYKAYSFPAHSRRWEWHRARFAKHIILLSRIMRGVRNLSVEEA